MTTDRAAASAFGSASPHVVALDRLLTRLEAVEQRLRAAEAEKAALLVAAFDIAAVEGDGTNSAVPGGARGELAYRAVRAEIAVSLQLSERAVERQLNHATAMNRGYPRVSDAFADGRLSLRHTSVIVDAGAVIGSGDDVDTVMRRAAYETSVLEVALTETPARLVPIARRLAEQCARVTLDERHEEARCRRSVTVRDLDDGMADLIAHLPIAEAHGIFDRLTRMSHHVERVEAHTEQPVEEHAQGSVEPRVGGRLDLLDSDGEPTLRDQRPLPEACPAGEPVTAGEPLAPAEAAAPADAAAPDEPRGSGLSALPDVSGHLSHALRTPCGTPRVRRTRDAIRADLLTTLLLAGPPEGNDQHQSASTLEAASPSEAANPCEGASPSEGADACDGANAFEDAQLFPGARRAARATPVEMHGLGAVRAHVQVVVPVSALGTGAAANTEQLGEPDAWFDPVPVALLAGAGPIDLDSARQLAAHADHWDVVRVAPTTGAVLAVDRYRPSAEMRRILSARDQRCRFPGCGAVLAQCDIDHTVDAALGGATAIDNLAHLCRAHHTLKHHSGWSVSQVGNGVLDWRSPTGRHRTDRPPGHSTSLGAGFERTASPGEGRDRCDRRSDDRPNHVTAAHRADAGLQDVDADARRADAGVQPF